MIFVIEGLPGAGKTIISKKLEKEQGFIRIGEVLDSKEKELSPIETRGKKQSFFLESDLRKYSIGIKDRDKNIIIDRGPLSTIAYNSYLREKEDKNLMEKLRSLSKKYSENVIYIYVKINSELSINRKPKNVSFSDIWSFENNLKKTEEIYDKAFLGRKNTIVINGNNNIPMVYKDIVNKIKSYSKT